MNNSGGWTDTKAGKALESRLNDEQVVNTMNRILDRLDVIESSLNALHQAPGMISMVTDMTDEAVRTASARGVDIDERLRSALAIAEKLTAPSMVKKINALVDAADQTSGMVSMTVDIIDDTVKTAAENGVDINERLGSALVLAEKLTEPHVVGQINNMLDMMSQSSGLVAMAADSFDGIMQVAIDKGVDPQEFITQLFGVTTKLAHLLSTDEMKEIIEGGIFDVGTLKVIGAASSALVESNDAPAKKVGLFGMMREMKNPDMQKALGFLTTFARLFGKKIG